MINTGQILTSHDTCTNKQTAKAEGDLALLKCRDLSLSELFDMFPGDRAAMEWFEEGWCINTEIIRALPAPVP